MLISGQDNIIRQALQHRMTALKDLLRTTGDEIITLDKILGIVRQHVDGPLLGFDAGTIADPLFFACVMLAERPEKDENGKERERERDEADFEVCVRALKGCRWAFGKADERVKTLKIVWNERFERRALLARNADPRTASVPRSRENFTNCDDGNPEGDVLSSDSDSPLIPASENASPRSPPAFPEFGFDSTVNTGLPTGPPTANLMGMEVDSTHTGSKEKLDVTVETAKDGQFHEMFAGQSDLFAFQPDDIPEFLYTQAAGEGEITPRNYQVYNDTFDGADYFLHQQ